MDSKKCKQIVNEGKLYKGFTLIELLAVIVILAIIAVIATPIILGVIDDSRLKGKENSINGLLDSVKMAYTTSQLTTTPLSLPLTSSISSSGVITITDKNGVNKVVEYSGEKPVSGSIKMDMDGNLSAISIKYNDGYTCSMGVGEHGCSKSRFTSTDSFFVADPNDSTRMVYRGGSPRNYIMLDEMVNGTKTPTEYRIISVEPDGSIKVVRQAALPSRAYDSRSGSGTASSPYVGPRRNEANPYCNYANSYDNYYGCNIWAKKSGTVNNVANTSVSTDSEMKTYLNNVFYGTLADSTKEVILTHEFNITGNNLSELGTSILMNGLYGIMNGSRKEEWVGKVGLPTIYDWFMATDKTNTACQPSTIGNGYYQSVTPQPTYTCGLQNYLKTSDSWWTITPHSASRSSVWYVSSAGCASSNYAFDSFRVRPVFYLSPSLQFTGDGTKGNPYKIKS